MKEYISKNWKKILYIIGGICIFINLIMIFTTPNNIISDFYKYGPVYKTDLVSIDADGHAITNELSEGMAESSGLSFDTSRVIVIFTILICLCLILDNIMAGSASKEKKK